MEIAVQIERGWVNRWRPDQDDSAQITNPCQGGLKLLGGTCCLDDRARPLVARRRGPNQARPQPVGERAIADDLDGTAGHGGNYRLLGSDRVGRAWFHVRRLGRYRSPIGLTLLLASVLVIVGAGAITVTLGPDDFLDAAVTFGIVATTEIALLVGVAGAIGQLERAPVLVANGAIAVLAVTTARRARARLGLRLPKPGDVISSARREPWLVLILAIAAAAVAWQLLVALVLPPFAYDALTYHLTTVADWIQHGSLHRTDLSLCCSAYPFNADLMFAWPMLLAGSDALVDTVQIGFLALGASAVAGIARSAGLDLKVALAAAALFAMTPIVLTQSSTNFVDIIVTAWALAAVHAMVRFWATGDLHRLVPAALATGLVLGTKGTGLVWAVVLAVTIIVVLAAPRHRSTLTARPLVGVGALLVTCLALGSFWYIRNLIDTGNPLHPFRVEVAGTTLFEGPLRVSEVLTVPPGGANDAAPISVARSWVADVTFWRHGSYNYQERAGGLGPLWPWLGLPLLAGLSISSIRKRNPLVLALIVVGAVFALQPYRWWSRFTIQLAALGAIAIAAAAWWPRRWLRRSVRAAACVLALAGVVLSSAEVDPASRAKPLPALEVLRLAGRPGEERTVGRLFFSEYAFVDEIPDSATVVVDLEATPVRFVYPFFGSRYSRRVLPATDAAPPEGSWVVTAAGRPIDRLLQGNSGFTLVSDLRGVRAWCPSTARCSVRTLSPL